MTYTPNYGPLFQPGLVAKNAPETSKAAAESIDAGTLRAGVGASRWQAGAYCGAAGVATALVHGWGKA